MQTKIRMAYRSDSSIWETAPGKPDKPRGKLLVQLTETVPERGSDIIAPPSFIFSNRHNSNAMCRIWVRLCQPRRPRKEFYLISMHNF
jgi:hypothetical protein